MVRVSILISFGFYIQLFSSIQHPKLTQMATDKPLFSGAFNKYINQNSSI
jgi:hypothetical protein